MKWFHCAFFHHYLDLNERASRREFWWYQFVVMVMYIGSGALSFLLSDAPQEVIPVIDAAMGFVLLCPSYSLFVRRLHDTGRSGWWGMLLILPVAGWFCCFSWQEKVRRAGTDMVCRRCIFLNNTFTACVLFACRRF